RPRVFASSHAEGGDFRMLERQLANFLEIFRILRIRKRVSAFDEVNAHLVEPLRQQQFVLEREVHALALAAVAQSRVVDRNSHVSTNKKAPERIKLRGRESRFNSTRPEASPR